MTQGIEDMLNIPHMDEVLKEQGIDPQEINVEFDFDQANIQLTDSEGADHAKAMDVIHKETLGHSRDLMDLAYNVDERSRRGILEIATSMYKNAIDAKNSKRDFQLKAMKIMQDQQKLDLDERKFRAEMGEEVVESKATIIEDRNELIRRILAEAKQENDHPDK